MASLWIPAITSWQGVPWPRAEANVHALQRRIYRAEQRGPRRKLKSLQRLLLRSTSAKLLAVRRVTQDNQGKKTPGVDGVAALEPEERLALVAALNRDAKPQPIRRVWIPKPGTDEQRPLGKDTRGRPLGFKTLVTPSPPKVVIHQRRLADLVARHRAAPQDVLIGQLNPVIRGWCNYYRAAAGKRTFSTVRHRL